MLVKFANHNWEKERLRSFFDLQIGVYRGGEGGRFGRKHRFFESAQNFFGRFAVLAVKSLTNQLLHLLFAFKKSRYPLANEGVM